jgi:ethanolamine ammonia-lyase large subunit
MAQVTNELQALVAEIRDSKRWQIYQQVSHFPVQDINDIILKMEMKEAHCKYIYHQAAEFLQNEMSAVVDEWDAHKDWLVVDDEEDGEEDGEAERGDLSPGGDGYTEKEDCIPIIA